MHNPMTEGEALAVDVGALHDAAKFLAGRYSDHDGWVVAIRAAASALTAAQQPVQEGGGEVCRHEWITTGGGNGGPRRSLRCSKCHVHRDHTAPPSAPVGVEVVPPEAKKVEGTALGAGFVHKDDWAIPSGSCSVRIVDQRMAYGWNQCREEMLERIAQQPAQAAPVPCDAIPKHQWEVLSCEPNEYEPTMESGWQRCKVCGTRAHFNRERTPPGDDAVGGGHGR